MKILFTIGVLSALIALPYTLSAQTFKDKLKVIFPDGYTTQVESATLIETYTNPTTALAYSLDTLYSKNINENWHFKSFSENEEDDFSYLYTEFNAKNWDNISFPEQAESKYKKGDVKSVYYTQIYISKLWDFRQMFLRTPMAQGVYDVFINGMKVGSNLNTRNIATFDVTRFVLEGYNPLVIVCKDDFNVSKLEDNTLNKPLLNGDVSLFSSHKLKITDYRVSTYFTEGLKNGNVQIDIDIKTHLLNDKEARLMYTIYDREGNLVMRDERWTKMKMKDSYVVNFHTMIENVKLYSASNPHIYRVVIALIHENRIAQTISVNIPFIEVENNEKNYVVNSKDVGLYGVVWKKHDAISSDAEYDKSTINRMSLLKSNGFNAIMLQEPQREQFYSICDSLGFYVIDRANVDIRSSGESRGISGSYANLPAAKSHITKRVLSQHLKTKNNPSVVALLATNSMTNGYSLYDMYIDLKNEKEDLILASNGLDLEWNNDFLIRYKHSEKELEVDRTRLNFVVTDNVPDFKKYFDMVEKRDIAGVFIDEKVLNEEMKNGVGIKSVILSLISAEYGAVSAESTNSIIPKNEVKFICTLFFNNEKLYEQTLPATFEDVNKMELILDYDTMNKVVHEKKEHIESLKNENLNEFTVTVSAVIGYSVIESIKFKYTPKKIK